MSDHMTQTDMGISLEQSQEDRFDGTDPWLNDKRLVGDLRTDHAGETGAVFIYRGILTVARDEKVIAFAKEHLATESRHLELIEEILPGSRRSRLIPIWKIAGWMTGFLPALFGPRAVYWTIHAVETFVDEHYQEQIDYLETIGQHNEILAFLKTCQEDEQHHRDEAGTLAGDGGPSTPGALMKIWTRVVRFGSQSAVGAARHI